MVPVETSETALGAAYGLAVLGLAFFQRKLQYTPARPHTPIALSGVAGGGELRLETADGEALVAWHFPPRRGKPIVLYFHGASGALIKRVPRLRLFVESGFFGVLAVSYRGYGGSTGSRTEAGLALDAESAYRAALERYGADRVIIVGASPRFDFCVRQGDGIVSRFLPLGSAGGRPVFFALRSSVADGLLGGESSLRSKRPD